MNKQLNRQIGMLLLLWGLTITACGGQTTKSNDTATTEAFILPEVPAHLKSSSDRAAYVVSHYWDHFNFADTTLITQPHITEQAFADYLNLFPHALPQVVEKSIFEMLNRALTGNTAMFDHFADLYEKYLYDPNSPFRQEDYYIAVLRSIINNKQVDEIQKVRPRYQLEMALKNRPGDMAANIEFTLRNGQTMKLSGVSAEYVILFFNNPDCEYCVHVKELLAQLPNPNVKVVALYPDEEVELWKKAVYSESWINGHIVKPEEAERYDLRAIPSLYLLDKDKRVILKDAPIEMIFESLNKTK